MALEADGSNPFTHPIFSRGTQALRPPPFYPFKRISTLGCSQVGKAQDFDSCIPLVRVQPSQPEHRTAFAVRCSFFASFVRRGAAGPFSPARAERGRPSFSPGPFGKGALPNKRAFYAGSSFLSSDLATILPSSICTVRCSTSLPCDSTMSVARASSTSFSTARRRLRAPYFSL